jgi:SAM-dependent methyltransferase
MIRAHATTPAVEWTRLLACPGCRESLGDALPSGRCPRCARRLEREDNVVRWGEPPAVARPRHRRARDYLRSATYRLDPVASPYSPLALLTRHRTERYYERALTDDHLARAWAARYLHGLALGPDAWVLDHGCGRGRVCAFLSRLGHRVVGQDVVAHAWWRRLGDVGFAVAPADAPTLPWIDRAFELVVDSGVIGHLPQDVLARHAVEVHRRLRPGGTWLVIEANSLGFGTRLTRRYYGRLHALADVRAMARAVGYEEAGQWFEGIRSPVAPRLVAFLRAHLSWKGFDIADHGSWLERRVPAERRSAWVLRLRRPA